MSVKIYSAIVSPNIKILDKTINEMNNKNHQEYLEKLCNVGVEDGSIYKLVLEK